MLYLITSVTGIVKLTNTINGDQDKATPKAVNDAGYLTTFVAAFNNTTAQFVINDRTSWRR